MQNKIKNNNIILLCHNFADSFIPLHMVVTYLIWLKVQSLLNKIHNVIGGCSGYILPNTGIYLLC